MRYLFNAEVLICRRIENSTTSTVLSEEPVMVNLIEGVYLYIPHGSPVPERLHYCQQESNQKESTEVCTATQSSFFKMKKNRGMRLLPY